MLAIKKSSKNWAVNFSAFMSARSRSFATSEIYADKSAGAAHTIGPISSQIDTGSIVRCSGLLLSPL